MGRCKGNKRQQKKNRESTLRFVRETIEMKMHQHLDWASFPDESVITFTMGSFTYPPKKPEPSPQVTQLETSQR